MKSANGSCHICGSDVRLFAEAKIMYKYNVEYYQCLQCGFVQTEKPYWLDEAYSNAIIDSDIGLLNRNMYNGEIAKLVLSLFFDRYGTFMDYGGGYGILVRIMRDAGYNFYNYDLYCPNMFAQSFEADLCAGSRYELVTAFELFEHFDDPLEEISKILAFTDSIMFSTELLPHDEPKPGDWWYYALDGGQHISIYTLASLRKIAEHFGLNLYSNSKTMHLLTTKNIQPSLFEISCNPEVARTLSMHCELPSLIEGDYRKILAVKAEKEAY